MLCAAPGISALNELCAKMDGMEVNHGDGTLDVPKASHASAKLFEDPTVLLVTCHSGALPRISTMNELCDKMDGMQVDGRIPVTVRSM
jgi:hypothetical protein